MSLIRWKPQKTELFNDLDWDQPLSLFDALPMSRYFKDSHFANWQPAMDLSEDKDNYYVKADLPGLKKEEVSVTVEDNVLIIRGERKHEAEQKGKNYHRVERSYGVFERAINVGDVKADAIKAKYENGVLDVTLPKEEKVKAKNINIDVN